jgi:hypothetical protein
MAFEPGKSGNPKGRPKGVKDKRLMLKELSLENANGEAEKSLQFLVDVRNNGKASWGVRIEAAKLVIENVWGKPKQRMELTGKDGGPLTVNVVNYADPDRPR